MEEISCIICGSTQRTEFIHLSDRLADQSGKVYYLVQCSCGFVYLNPRPTESEIGAFYKHPEYEPYLGDGLLYRMVQNWALRWKYKKISRTNNRVKGKLLDIGGGQGGFCSYMKKKGWDTTLQDPNDVVGNRKNNNDLKTIRSLCDLKDDDKYELITLWHSLEHIHNIEDLYHRIQKHLKSEGILVVAVPNLDAPERKYFNEDWAPYDAPRHLYHFTPDNLEHLNNRYELSSINTYSLFQDTPYNIILSMKKKSLFNIIRGLWIWITSALITLIRGYRFSSSFMVICKKH